MRVAITGASGRMGRNLIDVVNQTEGLTVTAAIERPESTLIGADAGELAGIGHLGLSVVDSVESVVNDFDVLIDFTVPEATVHNLEVCIQHIKKL